MITVWSSDDSILPAVVPAKKLLTKRLHPDDIAMTAKARNEYLSGEIPVHDIEFRYKRKNGDWMWIRSRIKIVSRDDSGTPVRLVGTHTDITERKVAQLALHDSEERFRGAFDQSINPMVFIGFDGQMFMANKAIAQLSGYSIEELLDIGWENLIHADDLDYATK